MDNYSGHEEFFTENFIRTVTEASISHEGKYCEMKEMMFIM